jgi:hypothetical protein
MKKLIVAAVVVLFLFVSSTVSFPGHSLAETPGGNTKPAGSPSTFVNDNWAFLTDNDASSSLTVGDTLRNNNDTIAPGTVTVTYGVTGFGLVTTGTFTGSVAGSVTINNAITNTDVGGTVNVLEGTYGELVTANKTLSLLGARAGVDARTRTGVESVIRGADLGGTRSTSFNVTVSNVEIDGFTIQENSSGTQFGTGILLGAGISGSQVRNNIIQNNVTGLSLANGAAGQAVIERNMFRTNNVAGPASGHGIYTDQFVAGGTVQNVLIDNNSFVGNTGQGIGFSSTSAATPATNITVSNNLFDGNGRALYAFNLTNSSITSNTVQNSTDAASADFRLFEGVSGLTISGNVLQNGAGRALRISNIGTGAPDATTVTFRLNSISGYTGPAGTFEVDTGGYAGTLDATCTWWGNITGPTIATNPGGTGQTLVDPDGVVDFQPWLVYAPDSTAIVPGVQFPTSFGVSAQAASFTATNNNYRRLINVIDCLQPGQTVILGGNFDWTQANAAASWALGNDGVASTADDFSLLVRPNLNNVTITATALGTARIQGPGDLAAVNLEGVFVFDGGDNQNWTISNLEIFDFDLSIGMFNGAGGSDAYNGTTITNNHIRIATDLNSVVAPADVNQNIGIHYSFGTNQTISGNQIDIPGDGISAGSNQSSTVGMQSNTSGGNVYDGLLIDNNTIRVLNAQDATNPQRILGIWENAQGHSSDITVSNNDFLNNAVGNNPVTNLQSAFRVTSHSSASTVVTYSGNTVNGANIGFEWLAGSNFSGNPPVVLLGNALTNVQTGFLIRSNGAATFTGTGNIVIGTGSTAGVAVNISQGSRVSVLGGLFTNSGIGIGVDGTLTNTVRATALIQGANMNNNSVAGLRLLNGAVVDAGGGGYTGLGTSTGSNKFLGYAPGGPGFAIQNLNTDGGFTGMFVAAPPDMRARGNIFASTSAAFIELVVNHDIDVATQGFVDFALPVTAAAVSVSGRILTADGRGITNARVVVTGNTLAEPRTALTGGFGYYTIDGLQAGETYIVTVGSKRFTFQVPSRVIHLVDTVTDLDFVAEPSSRVNGTR